MPFRTEQGGRIDITLRRHGNELALVIGDNGSGLPEGLDVSQTKSMGLQLVNIHIRRLEGKMEYSGGQGRQVHHHLPGIPPARRVRKTSKRRQGHRELNEKELDQQEASPVRKRFPVVGIGASAGGLEAFSELLEALPDTTGMAYVYIQHLDPTHKSMLSDILKKYTRMRIEEAEDGAAIEPDHVYIIPPTGTWSSSMANCSWYRAREPRACTSPSTTFQLAGRGLKGRGRSEWSSPAPPPTVPRASGR